MSTKTINTRIGLKYDSYANWELVKETFKPMKGEVIFFEIPASTGAAVNEPAILFKVGNGTSTLKDLPWGSAVAADVYAWAKQQSLLGGTYTSGEGEGAIGTWAWSEDTAYKQEQDEVAAFIKKETANIAVKVDQVTVDNFATIYGYDYDAESSDHRSRIGKYQTSVSTTGAGEDAIWTATGTPFAMEVTNYTASNGVQLVNNDFSVKLKDGEDNLVVDTDGLSTKVATVTYTEAEGETAANITSTEGLLNETAVGAIKSYVDTKTGETQTASVVTVEKLETANEGYVSSYVVKQNGTQVGDTINIPKDFLVKSATINTVSEADKAEDGKFIDDESFVVGDKYFDFVINTIDGDGTESHIYLNAKDLVDAYNGGETDFINVTVSENNVITATANTKTIAYAVEDSDGLATALDVKTYVGEQLAANVPNVEGQEAITVTDTEGTTSKTVSLKLNDVAAAEGVQEHVSGLKQSVDGLEINDEITWILECGGAPVQE